MTRCQSFEPFLISHFTDHALNYFFSLFTYLFPLLFPIYFLSSYLFSLFHSSSIFIFFFPSLITTLIPFRDALGYHGGRYEFDYSTESIHADLMRITDGKGITALELRGSKWRVSDDTVMMIATAEGIVQEKEEEKKDNQEKKEEEEKKEENFEDQLRKNIILIPTINEKEKEKKKEPEKKKTDYLPIDEYIYIHIGEQYVECFNDMAGRAPGGSCISGVNFISRNVPKLWDKLSFNSRGGGCGAAMRSTPIGLAFPNLETDIRKLISVSVESGRMTHNNPVGYLGSVAGALFTAYAINKIPIYEWGKKLINEIIPLVVEYIKSSGRDVDSNIKKMDFFIEKWKTYLHERNLDIEKPSFESIKWPDNYDNIKVRDAWIKSVSFSGWGGSSGHDAPLIAWDCLLAAQDNWPELCMRYLNEGDSDSIGILASAWFGAFYGFKNVPKINYQDIEFHDKLIKLADKLYAFSKK
ncbi:[protein adp-ribosylarginine] hydrolase [Anaeramoeba ignava]|uniref:ADP-ribosylhydrolase ARH1 n=1 Tax=Anaeramoeba ignava TaxID=1746090 RepID=A0A9Q0LRQ3_ANAIG|nr:[protein adp-ribosylarginine] hydrolase [Anaeramoeba ignava]